MSRWERYEGPRDRTFSRWHRSLPDHCTAIDLDFMEYCRKCRKPLALLEIAQDVGQAFKPTTVLKNLSQHSNIPAFLILYRIEVDNEAIGDCRVARVWPSPTDLHQRTAEQVRQFLTKIHDEHECSKGNK